MSETLIDKIAEFVYEKSPGKLRFQWNELWPENREYWRNVAREVVKMVISHREVKSNPPLS